MPDAASLRDPPGGSADGFVPRYHVGLAQFFHARLRQLRLSAGLARSTELLRGRNSALEPLQPRRDPLSRPMEHTRALSAIVDLHPASAPVVAELFQSSASVSGRTLHVLPGAALAARWARRGCRRGRLRVQWPDGQLADVAEQRGGTGLAAVCAAHGRTRRVRSRKES